LPQAALEQLDALLEDFRRIEAVLKQKGVSIPGFPTTRSAMAAWMIEDGLRSACRAIIGIQHIRANTHGHDDIALVENSPLWHLVHYHFPMGQAFPPVRETSKAVDGPLVGQTIDKAKK
jgi:hypothetical protein